MYTERVTHYAKKTVVSFQPLIRPLNPFIWVIGASSLCHVTSQRSFCPAVLPQCSHVIGATTELLLNFVKNYQLPSEPAKIIFIGGVNDIMQDKTLDEIIFNLESLIKHVKTKNKKNIITLATIPYISKLHPYAFKMCQISHLNEYITRKNMQLGVPTLELSQFYDISSFKHDGVHLTPEAKRVAASDLTGIINVL